MHAKISVLLFVAMIATFVVSCSSNKTKSDTQNTATATEKASASSEAKQTSSTNDTSTDTPPPADSKLAQIKEGMTDIDVRRILGEPMSSNSYMTGKRWIPFYYGADTSRTDYLYAGLGRVVFSNNRYTRGLKVIRVIYDPRLK